MHAKVTLNKKFGMKTSTKQAWTSDSNTRVMKENKAMPNVYFVPKDVQRILSSHKESKKCNGQEVFYKKAVK